ncbi:4-nitrophenylphosphatase [Mycena kentingensis (nom. inval.)]|nr:4-nitrophenylphosphatase [Mycena kentingensis (nom. inval.)]
MAARLTAASDYEALLDKYDTWMFDCDGVLWHGDRLIDGAVDVLSLLRARKKQVIFVTNNATKSRKSYKGKFDQLGVEAHVDEIYGSAYAAAVYISSVVKLPKDKKVYVIGMKGMEEELHEEGVSFIGGTDPADSTVAPFSLADFTLDPSVGAVLCGLDTAINYTKLSKAFQYLKRNSGCLFLVTNEDSTYPAGDGLLPGAGSISAPLRYALGRDPVAIGKPASTMLDCIKAKVDYDPKRTIMVGDRLNTDILFGQNGGLATLLVLTGITSESEISGPNPSPIVPDYVTSSIGDLRAVKPLEKAPTCRHGSP